jgi:hypothetical protein
MSALLCGQYIDGNYYPYLLEKMSDQGYRVRLMIYGIDDTFLYCSDISDLNYKVRLEYVYLEKIGGVYYMCIPYTHNSRLKPLSIEYLADKGLDDIISLVEYYKSLTLDYTINTLSSYNLYLWNKHDKLPIVDDKTCLVGLDINYRISEVKCDKFILKLTSKDYIYKGNNRLIKHITRNKPDISNLTSDTKVDNNLIKVVDLTKYKTIICLDNFTLNLLSLSPNNESKFIRSPCDRIPFLGYNIFNGINNSYQFGYIIDVTLPPTSIIPNHTGYYYEDILNGNARYNDDQLDSNVTRVTSKHIESHLFTTKNKLYMLSFDKYENEGSVDLLKPLPQITKVDARLENKLYRSRIFYHPTILDDNYVQLEYKPLYPKRLDTKKYEPYYNNQSISLDSISNKDDNILRRFRCYRQLVGLDTHYLVYCAY